MLVRIATDGSGRTKGPGGWAAVLRFGDSVREISGAVQEATNNTMEVTAAIMALRELRRPCEVELTTDSEYLLHGITRWLLGWKRRDWMSRDGEPVKNRDLWLELEAETKRHLIEWKWTKGHVGHVDNERADVMAGERRRELKRRLDAESHIKRLLEQNTAGVAV